MESILEVSMLIKNNKQREFWQERNAPAKVRGFPCEARVPTITAEQHRKRIQRGLDRDPRFIIDESI